MRGVLMFIVIAAIGGGLFVWQKQQGQKTATEKPVPQSTPAPRQTYEHDWAKHSLDTTHSVIDQIQRQRKDEDLKEAVGRR
jgi:hypothetical protein